MVTQTRFEIPPWTLQTETRNNTEYEHVPHKAMLQFGIVAVKTNAFSSLFVLCVTDSSAQFDTTPSAVYTENSN